MPGDEFIAGPIFEATHAISISVPPARVWPWLTQMGAGRGGWYSYDWIDNGGRPSATQLVPGSTTPSVGDVVPALPGATDAFIVVAVEEERHLVLGVPMPDGSQRATWGLILEPRTDGTRLLARARLARLQFDLRGRRLIVPDRAARWLAGPAHAIMQRRQLLGLRSRAESVATGRPVSM